MKEKRINFKSKTFYNLIFGLTILAILAKIYQYTFMKAYSFGIMSKILGWLNTTYIPKDNSYAFPLKIYRHINFFGFSTNLEWSIFWCVLMNVVFLILLLKYRSQYCRKELIFIYASMFILDVFVFNMNKDLIQLIIVLIIYGIINCSKLKNSIKIIMVSRILLYESIVFRPYYILIAGLMILCYFVLKKMLAKEKNDGKNNKVILIIVILMISMFVGIFCTKFIFPDSYNQLIHRRDNLENDIDANTLITNWITGDSFEIYCLNYCINFIRICFPIELLLKGPFYIFFVIYQLFLTRNILIGIKHMDKRILCCMSFVLAYWLTLVASESDFGTLVRHQSILFMFYMMIVRNNINIKVGRKLKNEEN